MVFAIPTKGDISGYTLGPLVALWMEQYLVFGPGDVRGQPYKLDDDKRRLLSRIYEIHPPGTITEEGKDIAGRRRFKRVGISVRKGVAKTEFGAAIAAAELHPNAPVRCCGFAKGGEPTGLEKYPKYKAGDAMGTGVQDPYIPMVAFTEEQSDELAYGALLTMLEEGPLKDDFELGIERILVRSPSGRSAGKAVALAGSPDARDGARTSFNLCDETHRWISEKLVKAHQTMLANVPKRYAADAWSLEITTAYEPGLGSVAEKTMEYARAVADGKVKDSKLFFYHRQASDEHQLRNKNDEINPKVLRAAVIDASGPDVVKWSDIDAICELALDPTTDPAYFERIWLNKPVQQSSQAFPMGQIDKLAFPDWKPPEGSLITIGFDGAQVRDTTAIVFTEVETGRQHLYTIWQNPGVDKGWRVPMAEVNDAMDYAFNTWNVWRAYCDPYYYETEIAGWVAKYMYRGEPRVFSWPTNTHKKMALSLKGYISAMHEGNWSYDGNPIFRSHLANARKHSIPILDEDETNLFLIRKERPDSPLKIDAAMAGCLSHEAYRDAIAAGANRQPSRVPITIY